MNTDLHVFVFRYEAGKPPVPLFMIPCVTLPVAFLAADTQGENPEHRVFLYDGKSLLAWWRDGVRKLRVPNAVEIPGQLSSVIQFTIPVSLPGERPCVTGTTLEMLRLEAA
jgi:hypothetical protein